MPPSHRCTTFISAELNNSRHKASNVVAIPCLLLYCVLLPKNKATCWIYLSAKYNESVLNNNFETNSEECTSFYLNDSPMICPMVILSGMSGSTSTEWMSAFSPKVACSRRWERLTESLEAGWWADLVLWLNPSERIRHHQGVDVIWDPRSIVIVDGTM